MRLAPHAGLRPAAMRIRTAGVGASTVRQADHEWFDWAHHEGESAPLVGVGLGLLRRLGCWGVWFDSVRRRLWTGSFDKLRAGCSGGSGKAHYDGGWVGADCGEGEIPRRTSG